MMLLLSQASGLQLVTGNLSDVIGLHRSDVFAVPRGLADDPDQGHADTGMREHRAPGRTRQSARTPHRRCKWQAEQAGTFGKVAQRTRDDKYGEPNGERSEGTAAAGPCAQDRGCD